MTLLSLVQSATDRINLPRPSVVVTATDATVRELLALANQEGQELARMGPWQALRKEKTFTSLAQETQTSMVASDLSEFVDETFWNRTAKRPLWGPLSPQEWQSIKAMTTSPVTDTFTMRGGNILINPVPAAGQTFTYEYISDQWCQNAAGDTDRSAWAADDDTGKLPERLMGMGLIWRYKKARGMSFEIEYAEWEAQVRTDLGADMPRRTTNFASAVAGWRKPGITVPSMNWPV